MKKGLRPTLISIRSLLRFPPRPNCCPDEEGIKTSSAPEGGRTITSMCPNCCPDEEGIKTRQPRRAGWPGHSPCPNCCPDEEGIKTWTMSFMSMTSPKRFIVRIAALMKKGLRPYSSRGGSSHVSKRPNCCPDEEGIKTSEGSSPTRSPGPGVRIAALMKKGLRRPDPPARSGGNAGHKSELLP